MSRIAIFAAVAGLFLLTRCYTEGAPAIVDQFIPSGAVAAPAPDVSTIGTPAATALPETDLTTWFAADATDPYAPTTWSAVSAYMAEAGTRAGWSEVCKQASDAAGGDRAANPALGAIACSDDPSVTLVQRFAVGLLAMRAEVALFIRAVPGHSIPGISGRQGELRVMCGFEAVASQGGADSVYGQACASAMETAYLAGDPAATFITLATAYDAIAAEIATRSPKTAPEPAWFDGGKD
ncbi:MAG: hypothetical protein HY875_09005 [Chloroflexi bacterium]|nr:hypothetical protein [Chloroflexota bacterium]